jgi:hypothetical protein
MLNGESMVGASLKEANERLKFAECSDNMKLDVILIEKVSLSQHFVINTPTQKNCFRQTTDLCSLKQKC